MYKKTKVFEIIFYVLAGLFLIYTLYSIFITATYIASVTASGMYGAIAFSDILNSYISQCAPYFFYACSFFFFGYVLHFVKADEDLEEDEIKDLERDILVTGPVSGTGYDEVKGFDINLPKMNDESDLLGEPFAEEGYEPYATGQAELLEITSDEPLVGEESEQYTIGQAEPLGIEPDEPLGAKEAEEMEEEIAKVEDDNKAKEVEDKVAQALDDSQVTEEIDNLELENEEEKEEESI